MDIDFSKYEQPKPKTKRPPRNEREEVVEAARQINGTKYIQTFQLTKHLPEYIIHRINTESLGKPEFWWALFNNRFKQNNMEQIITQKLKEHPLFRERSKRDRYLTIISLRDIGVEVPTRLPVDFKLNLDLETLTKFAVRYGTAQRIWREILMKNESLRGKDWQERAELEQQFVSNLRK